MVADTNFIFRFYYVNIFIRNNKKNIVYAINRSQCCRHAKAISFKWPQTLEASSLNAFDCFIPAIDLFDKAIEIRGIVFVSASCN